MVDTPEKIWASSVTENYGEWRTTTSGMPRPTEYTRSDLVAELAAENERLRKDRDYWKVEAEGERAKVAYRDQQALSRTGAVKELEWARGWMNAEAQTEIGQYTITYRRDGSFEWGIGILKGWASSWDAAKSAAQADYERRILSALVPSHQVKHNP